MDDQGTAEASPSSETTEHKPARKRRAATTKPRKSPGSRQRRIDRKLVASVAERTVTLGALDDADLALVATVAGVDDPTDLVAVVTAVVCATKDDRSVVDDILMLADSDPMEAGMVAAGMTRREVNAAIRCLEVLVGHDKVQPAASDSQTALALARAVVDLAETQPEHLDRLRGVREMIWGSEASR